VLVFEELAKLAGRDSGSAALATIMRASSGPVGTMPLSALRILMDTAGMLEARLQRFIRALPNADKVPADPRSLGFARDIRCYYRLSA
jgi:hypothetical protein